MSETGMIIEDSIWIEGQKELKRRRNKIPIIGKYFANKTRKKLDTSRVGEIVTYE